MLPRLAFLLAIALAGLLAPLPALAELMLNPTRLVFGKNQRAAQIELINTGSASATYRISLVNRRMSETGEFSAAETPAPGELFADAMLSFAPRQVTLQPGTVQTVRVMVRRPAELARGEYRSHLHFEKLAAPAGAASVEARAVPEQQIGVVLSTLVGASIPVIVRHETTGAQLALTGLVLQDNPPTLAFQIERGGDASAYGDLRVTWSAAGQGELVLGKANGVAIYTPNPVRRASIALTVPPGVTLRNGVLNLALRERAEAGAALLAQASLALP